MRIVLVRHAHAIEGDTLADEDRWLSAEGRAVARRLGARLREEGVIFGVLIASPLVRAVQTAELLGQGLGWGGVVEALHALAPAGATRVAAADLASRGDTVCAVGHEPGISAVAGALVGRPVPGFKKGQAVVVEDGRVILSIDPDTLFR